MVHWNLLAGNSRYMGSDENGPYAHLDPEWYYDGISWAKLTDFGYSPSVFMLRVHALLNSKKNEILLLPGPGSKQNKNIHHDSIISFPDSNSESITHNPSGLLGFNIYHLWVFSVPDFTDTIIPWTMFATVPPLVNEYIEYNLLGSGRVYYRVTAVYDEGESEPSNYDWVGFSGKEDPDRIGITVLPNPAGNYMTFELHRLVGVLRLYDPFGRLTLQRDVTGEELCSLDTSGLPDGMYLVQFQLSDGLVQTKKIIIVH